MAPDIRAFMRVYGKDDEIVRAIRSVANGEANFSSSIAARLIEFFRHLNTPPSLLKADIFPELTKREREVLGLIAQGKGNEEIAHVLSLSVKTVRNHTSNIFNKLQVATRAQAIVQAREAGLRM
jgi:DNA-binding NarL/FixJ family response regulator